MERIHSIDKQGIKMVLIAKLQKFFDRSNQSQINEALSKISLLASNGKLKTAYIFETIAGVTISNKFDGLRTAIELNTECNEFITLRFPSVDQVLLYEKLRNTGRDLCDSNHTAFLDKHVDELLHCK